MVLRACTTLDSYFLMSSRFKVLQGHLSQLLRSTFIVLRGCMHEGWCISGRGDVAGGENCG